MLLKKKTYICHHGINGQKWGIKHGPPYPLSRQSTSERSIVKNVMYINGIGPNGTEALNSFIQNGRYKASKVSDVNEQLRIKQESVENFYNKNKNTLQEHYKLDIKKLKTKPTIKEAAEKINTKRNTRTGEGMNNCADCSLNYCLRYLGYDVVANPKFAIKDGKLGNGMENFEQFAINNLLTNNKVINKMYGNNSLSLKNTTAFPLKNLEKELNVVAKENNHTYNNSFGQIGVQYFYDGKYLGSHSLNYNVTDSGKLLIVDSQSNKIDSFPEYNLYYSGVGAEVRVSSILDWSNVTQADIDDNLIDYTFSNSGESFILKGNS